MFNLPKSFDTVELANQGFVVEIAGPTNVVPRDESGNALYSITVLGADSAAYNQQVKANTTKRLNAGRKKFTAEELDAEVIGILVAITVAWDGFKDGEGKAIPCTKNNAITLYTKYPDIRAQVDAASSDRTNFLPKSGTSLENSQNINSGLPSPSASLEA